MINTEGERENAFKIFVEKMLIAEQTVERRGYYSEKEVEVRMRQYIMIGGTGYVCCINKCSGRNIVRSS